MNMKNKLEKYGLHEIGCWIMSNHKSTKHLSHLQGINFNIEKSIGNISNAVYAFVANDNVLYIGETTAGINSRFQSYRYGNPLKTDTDNRVKKAITKLLENNTKVTIWFTQPVGKMELPSGENIKIPASKPLEELLISELEPEYNVKNVQKKG